MRQPAYRLSSAAVIVACVLSACSTGSNPPEPAAPPLSAAEVPDPALTLDITAQPVCNAQASHLVDADWLASDVQTVNSVTVQTLFDNGEQVRATAGAPGHSGSTGADASAEDGGVVIVTAVADTDAGELQASRVLTLPSCSPPPPPPGPGEHFAAPPTNPPQPPIAIPGSPITESDFVHLGGSPSGGANTRLVSAVGTGAVVKLSSWTLNTNTLQAEHLADHDQNIVGYNVRLHVLTPDVSPKLAVRPFIVGVIRSGKLWLTTWQLNADGSFLKLDEHGYGEDIEVRQFAFAHRSFSDGATDYFLIVTPIITDQHKIRIVTWAVDKSNGNVTGLQDSGDVVSTPGTDSLLHITRIPGNESAVEGVDFVVTYENTLGDLSQQLWAIHNDGLAFLRGVGASGLNLRGSKPVSLPGRRQAVMPMNGSGYALATSDDGLTTDFSTWDFQKPFLDPLFVPHRLSDNSRDQLAGPGLDIGAVPSLTDGSAKEIENGATQKVRAMLTDAKREQDLGVGGGAIVDILPPNEFKSVGIASVTKVMTLLLAIEAVGNGEVDFNDIVTVSENAASTNGSSMNLVAGEKQSLINLLHGMMMVSGNDAAVAIAEHVAGSEEDFVDRMNQRAVALGMVDTWYNQPAGGGYSTPQDQITLFRFGSQLPDFIRIARKQFYVACGELANGDPVCRNVDKFKDNGYPGLNGWKNGNLGFHDPTFKKAGVPLCTSCLIVQAQRGGRTMLVGLQQSGNRWKDAGALFDYGYRRLWTPDSTGGLLVIGQSRLDIALDYIDDSLAVTATLTNDNRLELCSWSVFTELGQIDRLTPCTQRDYPNLVGDPNISVPADLLAGVRLSNAFSEGDYMTAMLDPSSDVQVRLWRVGRDTP